jgi:restriction system protein
MLAADLTSFPKVFREVTVLAGLNGRNDADKHSRCVERYRQFGIGIRRVFHMSPRTSGVTLRMLAREAARAARAHERQMKADAQAAARQHVASRIEEADELSQQVQEREQAIERLLARALSKNPAIDLLATQKGFHAKRFDDPKWHGARPDLKAFAPAEPGFFARLLPGSQRRYEKRKAEATSRYEEALAEQALLFKAYQRAEAARKAEADLHDAEIREAHRSLRAGEHAGVVGYFKLVLDRSLDGEPDAISAEVGYSPDSKHIVVDLELPEFSAIPEESSFRYVKSGDRIERVARPLAKRKALYSQLLSQIALKCVDTVFRSAPPGVVDCLTLNGMLDTIDPATGQETRLCLLSVRVTDETFKTLNLGQVQPEHCLRSLKASVSRAPAELLAVKPLIELDMVDPRFIETLDVMSGLDHRPNLMELTPSEFEGLITNLFATMGLDTRQTRPSRDGGVDCVAFDPRPVFGGKVVIQAKRYKNTVGVSAVRDLFGTVQNEGASKGILVTTSGYGNASFDFAKGKPLELLDGGNLLHLLAEHAGIEARIVMPDGWTDLPLHGE